MGKIVQTKYGKIVGVDKGLYYEYRGIPFAKPPIGELRWKAPVNCEPWDGEYKAVTYKPAAMQFDNSDMPLYGKEFYGVEGYQREFSEDCLYLNVWTPKKDDSSPCSVLVWIHGGAFHNGYSSEVEFDGEEFCKRNIILVTLSYRLGPFGFLSVPECQKRDGYTGNYGLMDQIMGLEWVKENIAAFGGDPESITLSGQSAGASSVMHLCCSELAKGLFQKAIMNSGAGYQSEIMEVISDEEREKVYFNLLKHLQINDFEELIKVPAMDIMLAYQQAGDFLRPCVDGKVLKNIPNESLRRGEFLDIPYILGANKNDLFAENTDGEKPGGELWDAAVRFAGLCQEQKKQIPYLYYFSHDLPGSEDGAFHSAELWYVFGTLGRCWRPMKEEDFVLSNRMLEYWCSFIKTGNPNSLNNQTTWDRYSDGKYMSFC